MDKLDLEIFRSLLRGPDLLSPHSDIRKPLLSVAKELGVDEGTVRRRLARLEEVGFLKGWRVFINPVAMGKLDLSLRFEVLPPSSKEDVVRKVRLLDGVYLIRKYQGSRLGVEIICDDELSMEKNIELISRIANAESISRAVVRPGTELFRFDSEDLALVRSILDDPRKPFDKIAAETGLPPRKVRRKLLRMTDARALLVTRSLDYSKLTGMVKGDLIIFYDSPSSKNDVDDKVLRIVGERLLVPYLGSQDHMFVSLMLENLAERSSILDEVMQVKGVGRAYLDLIEDTVEVYRTFRQKIELAAARVESTGQVRQTRA